MKTVSAGAYVGRVGGLAAALGIGLAIFAGPGVASAEPTAPSGSSAHDGGAAESSGNAERTSDRPTTGGTAERTEATAKTDQPASTSAGQQSTAEADADTAATTGAGTHSRTTHSGRTHLPSNGDGTTASASHEPESSADSSDPAHSPDRASTTPPHASGVVVTTTTEPTGTAGGETAAKPIPATTTAVDVGTGGDRPMAPSGAALLSAVLGAAPREVLGGSSTPASVSDATAVSGAKDSAVPPSKGAATVVRTASPASTTTTAARPTPVVAVPHTALLQGLQYIPVIGPTFVTPLVAIVNQLPVIGSVLHPLLGYPVNPTLATGTPVPRDVKVVSFDGTQIYTHFLPATGLAAGATAPTILDGPGIGLPGDTNYNARTDALFGNAVIGIGTLRDAGYNVVTWDPRGEWNSGGTLEVDSPDYEARDVSAIISWVATQPEVQLDGAPQDLDPRMGMVGLSYGGGIQLVTAAGDHRVDAIVPTMAWHSLNASLYKSEAFKSGWGTLLGLALLGTFSRPNPALYPALIYGDLTGLVSQSDQELLAERGPGDLIGSITAPTMLVQGTVDTLFSLQEADDNATGLLANHVPTKVVWFCGGHGTCVTGTGDGSLITTDTLNWLARYVKGDTMVDTGPQFEWVDQNGAQFSAATYPVHAGTPVVTSTTTARTLPIVPIVGGSGPQPAVFRLGPLGALLGLPSAARAANAINLTTTPAATTTYVVGAPRLSFTYNGIGTARNVYAQLVDDRTGLVLGNLVTPVSVTLDGRQHVVTVDMEQVAQTLAPGDTLTLQLVASTVNYQTFGAIGALAVSDMTIALPTADPASVTTLSRSQTV